MAVFRPSVDVRPVTEFRAHTSAVLEQVQTTKRPVVPTQHGRTAAVPRRGRYESLVEEVALARDVRTAEASSTPAQATPTGSSKRAQVAPLDVRLLWSPLPLSRPSRPSRTSPRTIRSPPRPGSGSRSSVSRACAAPRFRPSAPRTPARGHPRDHCRRDRVVNRRHEESVAIAAIRHQTRDVDEDEIAP